MNSNSNNGPRSDAFTLHSDPPWPEPVDGSALLDELARILTRRVVLPKWAAETLALWVLHTYAFELRDVTTYIGIESPEKRCGKTTLLGLLNELAHRAVASSNISPPAFFRVIEDFSPTLLIDEVDTFLKGNDQLKGILNAGYHRKAAFVLRAGPAPASSEDPERERFGAPGAVKRFSCWCPKVLAKIGPFPDTLADRCIVIRMNRKTSIEKCDRSRQLDPAPLRQRCARFVLDHAGEIASAQPQIPSVLNDRAADIWEPIFALADLAGGPWPESARQAAVHLTASAQDSNPIGSLLFDIFKLFALAAQDRIFTRALLFGLNQRFTDRPWMELRKGKEVTEMWLAQKLRPYGIRPKTLRIQDQVAKGYAEEDFREAFRRYIPRSELEAFRAELTEPQLPAATDQATSPAPSPDNSSSSQPSRENEKCNGSGNDL
jgi:hypothetical protein